MNVLHLKILIFIKSQCIIMDVIVPEITNFVLILRQWEDQHLQPTYDPLPILIRLAEIIEGETDNYVKMDPDPFDERHPYRVDPDCALGHILKIFSRKRNFVNTIVNDYFRENYWALKGILNKDSKALTIAVCRLILDVMPDPETSAVFQLTEMDSIVLRLYSWAENSEEPLQTYATGMLAAAMKVRNRIINFRDQNSALIPLVLQRINQLQSTDVSAFKLRDISSATEEGDENIEIENILLENIKIYPITLQTKQMFIIRYLSAVGKLPEFLDFAVEHNVLKLIMCYLSVKGSPLTLEALKYLAVLLCHKQFCKDFLNMNGLEVLLSFPPRTVMGTAVSVCFFNIANNSEVMEEICQLHQTSVASIVRYMLKLFESCHDSGQCHAVMFFGVSFRYYIMLKHFDAEDGLHKLYNLISSLPILSLDDLTVMNDDEENAARKIIKHVCITIKNFFAAHLCIKADAFMKSQGSNTYREVTNSSVPFEFKLSSDEVKKNVSLLFSHVSFCSHWKVVEQFIQLGGIKLFLQIIEFSYDWNTPDGSMSSVIEVIVQNILDALTICCLMSQVKLLLCDPVELLEDSVLVGMNIILKAAEGNIIYDPEVQRSALNVIITCVCAPIYEVDGAMAKILVCDSARKKTCYKTNEEILCRVWESVRNNGMMILLHLMFTKTPVMYADSIRALACQAVVGLARSETIRQNIRKLPLFTRGQLQAIMHHPILPDKLQEHEVFQKYALELLECLEIVRKRKRALSSSSGPPSSSPSCSPNK